MKKPALKYVLRVAVWVVLFAIGYALGSHYPYQNFQSHPVEQR